MRCNVLEIFTNYSGSPQRPPLQQCHSREAVYFRSLREVALASESFSLRGEVEG